MIYAMHRAGADELYCLGGVQEEIPRQLQKLPTPKVASEAWENRGEVVVVESDKEGSWP